MSHFKATLYVTSDGNFIAASDTDQAGKRGAGEQGRTWCNRPVEICGDSYTVERNYQKPVIARAIRKARRRELESAIQSKASWIAAACGFAADTPAVILADYLEENRVRLFAANDFVTSVRVWQALLADEEAFAALKERRLEQLQRDAQEAVEQRQKEAANKRTQRKREQRRRAKQRRVVAETEKTNLE